MTDNNSSAKTRKRTGPKPKRAREVRLQRWLDAEGFDSVQLESAAPICRQTMTKIKAGNDVRLSTIRRILKGARILANRSVSVDELFDFEDDGAADTLI